LKRGVLVEESTGRRVAVRRPITIGRTRDCEFVIDDNSASRRHVEVGPRGESFIWKDLGSTNGTIVNGRSMLAGELRHGDTIQIGETVIRFHVEDEAGANGEDTGERTTARLGDSGLFQETILGALGEERRVTPRSKSAYLLETVYAVANELAADYDANSLMERVLELVMKAISAQRGAIFVTDDKGELAPCPVCVRGDLPSRCEEIRISHTVANKVIREGTSVLYKQSDNNNDLNYTESILSLEIRSILCVPLRAKDNILGILYIDSDQADLEYTEEDVLLAAAVGNSAGLALDNARMHLEMLEKQRIEHDLATAWTIQEGFLVKEWPEGDGRFQVYGETRPAKTVGGDFYDFVRPGKDRIGLLIGDVSGKGVPASLMMAQLLAEFRLLARDYQCPAEVMRQLNAGIARRSRRGMFCTACYIAIDLTTGEVSVATMPCCFRARAVSSSLARPAARPLACCPSAHGSRTGTRFSRAIHCCCIPMALSRRRAWPPHTSRKSPSRYTTLRTSPMSPARTMRKRRRCCSKPSTTTSIASVRPAPRTTIAP
jgi:sigma-B regulation protein RsbU (phosphoserine phosphatase)